MPVPTAMSGLSETPSSNSPTGAESVGTNANDYIQAAFAFIRQLYDGNLLPIVNLNMNTKSITNMAAGAANSSAATVGQLIGTLGAPSGTRMLFHQAAAPAGWGVDTNPFYSDCSFRCNSAAAGGIGGSVNWSLWNFSGTTFAVDSHILSNAEMPYHNHADFGHNHGVNDPGHAHGVADPGHAHGVPGVFAVQGTTYSQEGTNTRLFNLVGGPGTDARGTGIAIAGAGTGIFLSAAAANISFSGGNVGHQHTYTTPQMRYADIGIFQKA